MPRPTSSLRLLSGLLLLANLGPLAGGAPDPIQEVGKTATEWIKTRTEAVRAESTWTQDRALLTSTLNGLKERADRLQEKRDHLLATTAESRAEQAVLAAKLSDAKEALRMTEQRLEALTEKVLQLRVQLPPRLAEALEMSYRTLAARTGSPGERMQIVMTVLNRCAQFNLSVTQGNEILTLPGLASPQAVDVIYWGLSHGYALDRAAGKAWLGAPGPDGWRWEPLAAGTPAIAELLAIRRDEADPRLVSVPARLKATP